MEDLHGNALDVTNTVFSQNGFSNGAVSLPNPPAAAASDKADSYFDSLPDGYRFMPTDEELILCYLKKKIANEPLPPNRIKKVEFYEKPPEQFAEEHPLHREKERYFFTSRDRKYSKGERPGRTVKDAGFWKATGRQKTIKSDGEIVGFKKMLVFYRGIAKDNAKTNWVMLEYVAHSKEKRKPKNKNDMKLDDWVIVKLYENTKRHDGEKGTDDQSPKPAKLGKKIGKKRRKKESENRAQEEMSSHDNQPIQFEQEELLDSPSFNAEPATANCAGSTNSLVGYDGCNHYAPTPFTLHQQTSQANFSMVSANNNMYSFPNEFSSSNNFCISRSFAGLSSPINDVPFLGSMNRSPMASLEQLQLQEAGNDYMQTSSFSSRYDHGFEAEIEAGFGSASLLSDMNYQNLFDQRLVLGTGMESIPTHTGYTERLGLNSAPAQPDTETETGLIGGPVYLRSLC